MTCKDMDNLLPAYLEELLTPEEKQGVETHLASCRQCRIALADLQKTGALLRGLDEVEPPPWFKQRVMSRVRQEARQNQGIFSRLFFPLHIKVPIQAFATILVAMLAFHVYRGGEPEVKQMSPLPPPVQEMKKEQAAVPSPPAPPVSERSAVGAPEKMSPAGDHAEGRRDIFAPVPAGSRDVENRMSEGRKPGEMKYAGTDNAERKKQAAPFASEPSMKTETEAAGKVLAAPSLSSRASESKDSVAGMAKKSERYDVAPGAAQSSAKAAEKRPYGEVTVHVRDAGTAVGEIEKILGQFRTRILQRRSYPGKAILTVEIAAARVPSLLEKLKKVGEVSGSGVLAGISEGNGTVRIIIVADR